MGKESYLLVNQIHTLQPSTYVRYIINFEAKQHLNCIPIARNPTLQTTPPGNMMGIFV